MKPFYLFILFFFLITTSSTSNSIKSTSNQIEFKLNGDSHKRMSLDRDGLAIGPHNASANLDVMGNALVRETLSVGSESNSSSNLHVSGIMALSSQTISNSNTEIQASLILADSSSDNLILNLPNPAAYPGGLFHIKRISTSNNVTVTTNTYIDQSSSLHVSLESELSSIVLVSQNSHYLTISNFGTTTFSTWQPSSLGNLIGWYDASDTSTYSYSNGNINQLNDKSNYGNHLTQGTGTKRPTPNRSLNSRTILDFDGNDSLEDNNFPLTNNGNVAFYMVVDLDTSDHANRSVFSIDDTNDFQYTAGTAGQFQAEIRVSGLGSNLNGTTDYLGDPHIFQIIFDFSDGNYYRYVDGNADGSQTYSASIDSSPTLYVMRNRGGAYPADGGFAEMVIAEDVDTGSRQKVEAYLAWKWGLVDQLPSNHPYKHTPPN